MIEEQATVIKSDEKYVWVETQRQSSCGHCSAKSACGTQVLSKVLGNKRSHVRCLNNFESNLDGSKILLHPGDKVIIGLEESALISGSLLIYFIPLISMIFFGGLSVFITKIYRPEGVELISIATSLFGFFIGLRFVKFYSQMKGQEFYEPILLYKVQQSEVLSFLE